MESNQIHLLEGAVVPKTILCISYSGIENGKKNVFLLFVSELTEKIASVFLLPVPDFMTGT